MPRYRSSNERISFSSSLDNGERTAEAVVEPIGIEPMT